MNLDIWIPIVSAVSGALGYTLPIGIKRAIAYKVSRSNGKGATQDSVAPPSPEAEERRLIRQAARTAGFKPGDTSSFERVSSLGDMRCGGHKPMMEAVETVKKASESAVQIVSGMQTAVAAAAGAASQASVAAVRLEETVRSEGEQTRKTVTELSNKIGDMREWKGNVDGQLRSLWHEVRK
jgi:hypothetical protein